jgi:signal transduction histidine kinase/ActR/RegA family two-component response regulator
VNPGVAGTISDRVLVLLPTVRDAERTALLLQEGGVSSTVCFDLNMLCRELRSGAGAVLLADEAMARDAVGQLAEVMREQPPWSSVPVVLLAREGTTERIETSSADWLRGLIVVERPVRTRTLLSVILSALRGRSNQYQIRDALLLREQQTKELRGQEERLRSALLALQTSQAELARQAEQLREAGRRKDEFLATLAHELRNPLAPIQTGLDLLARSREQGKVDHALGVMHRQLGHMVRLIDDLLDVSRITQGRLELKRARVTLREMLDTAVEASRPALERRQHSLQMSVPEPSLAFDADLTRMAQVVSNLLNNASKYTPAGGLIELSAWQAGEHGVIEVRDNGIGIPPEHLEHVFEMFSQVNRATEGSRGGLGIGLALVRSLVELHGGVVSAKSVGAGQGSTFTVKLPLADAPCGGVEAERPSWHRPRDKRRVLVVDDNDDAADLLSLMLEQAEYATTKASDGPSALAAVESWTPDVVILDIGLPGMSGYEVARALRRKQDCAGLELIALTGWGSHEDKQRAMDAGFDVHLTKPVDAEKLYGALAQLEARAPASAPAKH